MEWLGSLGGAFNEFNVPHEEKPLLQLLHYQIMSYVLLSLSEAKCLLKIESWIFKDFDEIENLPNNKVLLNSSIWLSIHDLLFAFL